MVDPLSAFLEELGDAGALLDRTDELDGALESVGLLPVVPTEEVRVDTEKGWRITINGSYRKMAPPVDRRS
jgi:hypothetical protein